MILLLISKIMTNLILYETYSEKNNELDLKILAHKNCEVKIYIKNDVIYQQIHSEEITNMDREIIFDVLEKIGKPKVLEYGLYKKKIFNPKRTFLKYFLDDTENVIEIPVYSLPSYYTITDLGGRILLHNKKDCLAVSSNSHRKDVNLEHVSTQEKLNEDFVLNRSEKDVIKDLVSPLIIDNRKYIKGNDVNINKESPVVKDKQKSQSNKVNNNREPYKIGDVSKEVPVVKNNLESLKSGQLKSGKKDVVNDKKDIKIDDVLKEVPVVKNITETLESGQLKSGKNVYKNYNRKHIIIDNVLKEVPVVKNITESLEKDNKKSNAHNAALSIKKEAIIAKLAVRENIKKNLGVKEEKINKKSKIKFEDTVNEDVICKNNSSNNFHDIGKKNDYREKEIPETKDINKDKKLNTIVEINNTIKYKQNAEDKNLISQPEIITLTDKSLKKTSMLNIQLDAEITERGQNPESNIENGNQRSGQKYVYKKMLNKKGKPCFKRKLIVKNESLPKTLPKRVNGYIEVPNPYENFNLWMKNIGQIFFFMVTGICWYALFDYLKLKF